MVAPSFTAASSILLGSTGSTAAAVPSFAMRLHPQGTMAVLNTPDDHAHVNTPWVSGRMQRNRLLRRRSQVSVIIRQLGDDDDAEALPAFPHGVAADLDGTCVPSSSKA